jgi:hypothetical protein
MNTVSFQNKGLIDYLSIRTFGVSAKDCEDPIGFFGTGLKYAIAILLRKGCSITIYRGTEEIVFTTVTKTIRDKDFEVVCMNGEELGFTLELGKTWKMWQAFRELYCNTLDERGETFGNAIPLEDGHTTIVVTGAAFYQEYVHKDRTLLIGKADHFERSVEIHKKPGGAIHLQGVRVGDFERPSIFTYNILSSVDLTEDRTVKNIKQVNERVRQCILRSDNKELIKKFLAAPKDTYESTIDMDWFETPSDTFMEVLNNTPFKNILNSTILAVHKKHSKKPKLVPKSLSVITDIERQQLQKAIDFSHLLDFPVDKFVIHVTDDLRDEVLGAVLDDEIYIARRTFMQGTKMVAATLIEEYIHIEKGFADCEYPMQNFLFEKLVSMGEQLIGEAL